MERELIEKLIELDDLCRIDTEKKEIDIMGGPRSTAMAKISQLSKEYDMKGWNVTILTPPTDIIDIDDLREAVRRALWK